MLNVEPLGGEAHQSELDADKMNDERNDAHIGHDACSQVRPQRASTDISEPSCISKLQSSAQRV